MKWPKVRINILLLVVILALGIGFRLRNWNLGFIDAHPMRQTDSECVAYHMAQGVGSLLYPKNCLIRPVSNTQGYFFLEFPVYEGVIALGYKIFGINVVVVRMINLILYLVAGSSIYYFVKKIIDEKTALSSVLLFSMTPASIFFLGHALHPDMFAVATMTLSLAIMGSQISDPPAGEVNLRSQKNHKNNKKVEWIILISGILLGLSVATRPFGLIVLPVYAWILWKNKAAWWKYAIVLVLSLSFYGLWRWWTVRSGISADWENWVLAGREKLLNWGYFKNFLIKNVVGEVIGKVISGLFGLGLVISVIKKDKRLMPIISWILLIPVYWLLVPNGNMTHQYYGDIYILPVAVVAAMALSLIWSRSRYIGLVIIALVAWNGWRTSDYLFKDIIYPEKLAYAQEIKENIPEDAKVVYMVKSDSIPLSLAHRQGWMLGEWPTDVAPTIWAFMEMKHFGLEYLVEPKNSWDMKREDVVIVAENYPLFAETEHLRIYRWTK